MSLSSVPLGTHLAMPETVRALTLEELLGIGKELGRVARISYPRTPRRWDLVWIAAHTYTLICLALFWSLPRGSFRNEGLSILLLLLVGLGGGSQFVAAAEAEGLLNDEHFMSQVRTTAARALSTPATVQCEGLTSDQCGANLASAISGAEAVLELEDGTYTHVSTFVIDRDVVIRAKNSGQAVLDGEDTRRVLRISGGTVTVEGLEITKGKAVSALPLNFRCQTSRN